MASERRLLLTRRQFVESTAALAAFAGCTAVRTAGGGRKRALMLQLGANFGNPDAAAADLRFDESVYRRIVGAMAEAGVNELVLDLGEGVRYPSHPEIGVRGAWSAERLADEVARLKALGITAYPKLDFSSDRRAWLGRWALVMGTADYDRTVRDLIADVSRIFGSPGLFHLGWGVENERNQRHYPLVYVRRGEAWWKDFLLTLDAVRAGGSRPWVWGDRMVFSDEEFVRRCPKDAVVSHRYAGTDFAPGRDVRNVRRMRSVPEPLAESLCVYRELQASGFDQMPAAFGDAAERLPSLDRYCRERLSGSAFRGLLAAPAVPTVAANEGRLLKAVAALKTLVLSVAVLGAAVAHGEGLPWTDVPQAPSFGDWQFVKELSRPVERHPKTAYEIRDEFGLKGNLQTVRDDLGRFFADVPGKPTHRLWLAKGAVAGEESYRVDVLDGGDVRLTAEDAEGMRRAVCHFEDRVLAGDLKPVVRKPWLRHRLSRCFYAPIKRPPHNRDELADDVDYYPDAYLDRLAHEGVNGLWMSVALKDMDETRLAKLKTVVAKCRRYGIGTWLFVIEPRYVLPDDPILSERPELFSIPDPIDGTRVMCPSREPVRRYLTDSLARIFGEVPDLAGVLAITHGERPTTCFSWDAAVTGARNACKTCSQRDPWQLHNQVCEAMLAGMRRGNPKAELLSWLYQPQVRSDRAPWVADVARHLPAGVTMIYNFESGAVKEQLGRYRPGGDYWLSYAGRAPAFAKVADAAREAGGAVGAKIQACCSHECATVPYVSAPGLLYRKYAEMRKAGCRSVLQCWYFGNHPGLMNKAAGELAFCDFADDERTFLADLARPDWGEDAERLAEMWARMSDAYEQYPLSVGIQYYGPFAAGVCWPLLPRVEMRPLARTWQSQDAPSGDAIGECLDNFTLEEAALLSARMARLAERAAEPVARLRDKYAGNAERLKDLGLFEALGLMFTAGADAFEFYRQREKAVTASRRYGDAASAVRALERMSVIVAREKTVTVRMTDLARDDSRLGFHPEAERHQFHPTRLAWRLGELARTERDLAEIRHTVAAGGRYPLSAHERLAPVAADGERIEVPNSGVAFTASFEADGAFVLSGRAPCRLAPITLKLFDACACGFPMTVDIRPDADPDTSLYNVLAPLPEVRRFTSSPDGESFSFRLELDPRGWADRPERRPAWLHLSSGRKAVWPEQPVWSEYRLYRDYVTPDLYGRIAAAGDEGTPSGNVKASYAERIRFTPDTLRFQRQIDAASAAGGGRVEVPAGEYVIGSLRLKSGVELHLAEGARILGALDDCEYLHYDNPIGDSAAGVIFAVNATNVSVTGSGTVDGRGDALQRVFQKVDGGALWRQGRNALYFHGCRNVRIEGVELRQPSSWCCFLRDCDGVVARKVRIFAHANSSNDGFDVESSNVLIEDCDVDAEDDSLAIKSRRPETVLENIEVRNCRFSTNAEHLKIGTETSGITRNVNIHDCTVGCRTAPQFNPDWTSFPGKVVEKAAGLSAIEVSLMDGGIVENVTFRNITVGKGVITPICIRHGNRTARVGEGRSVLRNILIENVTMTEPSASCVACAITGVPGFEPQDITLRNVKLVLKGGGTREDADIAFRDERAAEYPYPYTFDSVLPAYGFYLRHARGIRFENVRLAYASDEARPAVVMDDAKVEFANCDFQSPKGGLPETVERK